MRYMLAAISTITLVAASLAQAPTAPGVIVIRAGTLIDGKSDQPRHDQVIIIRGDRIESVSDASSTKAPAGAHSEARHRSASRAGDSFSASGAGAGLHYPARR